MANSQRTYQWVNGQIEEVAPSRARKPKMARPRPEPEKRPQPTSGPQMGIQTALLLFTFSSVLLVFAGLALSGFFFALYAVIFG